jgi:SAM-dependent methyltransferase
MTDEQTKQGGPSLEQLLESGVLQAEILHPGGLEITRELADLCGVGAGKRVLDVAAGSGETACFLAETFQCSVIGIDASPMMVQRARAKARSRRLDVDFQEGDAHALPFADGAFDAAISECTTCVLDKRRAIREMVRVTKPGGRVGIHDLCWKEDTPDDFKRRLAELEDERPETLDGWKRLFEESGLTDVVTKDESHLIASWTRDVKRELGIAGMLKIYWTILRRWGLGGLRRIKASERVFRSEHLGYGLIVGVKPTF